MTVHRPDPETDPFRPPAIPTEVFCLHCQQEYESYLMEWREEMAEGKRHGFWCCPTPGCDGRGFGFDIFPIDPEYRDENGEPLGPFADDEEADDEDADEWMPVQDELAWRDPIDTDALLEEEGLDDGAAPPDAPGDVPPPIHLDDEADAPADGHRHHGRGRWSDGHDDIPW
ncbi:MAG: hypothetical protein WD534_00335 [Phycisphaeraceae bacterium]